MDSKKKIEKEYPTKSLLGGKRSPRIKNSKAQLWMSCVFLPHNHRGWRKKSVVAMNNQTLNYVEKLNLVIDEDCRGVETLGMGNGNSLN